MLNESSPVISQIQEVVGELAAAEARVRELKGFLKEIKKATRIAVPKARKQKKSREAGEAEVTS